MSICMLVVEAETSICKVAVVNVKEVEEMSTCMVVEVNV